MKYSKYVFLLFVVFSLIYFNGCLSSEYKIYKLQFNSDFSGKGSITWVNILSQKADNPETYKSDFDEIVNDYLNGSKLQDDFPNIKITSKKLYEEKGKLCGEMQFTFSKPDDLKFFQYDNDSPVMYYISTMNETYISSNGKYDADKMPVVFFDKKMKEITLKTSLSGELKKDDTSYVSLLKYYKKWNKKN